MLKNRLAIFFPSSREMIKIVMEFADLKKRDVFYDLGSGDGRILVEAAKAKIPVVGVEENRFLNWIARRKTKHLENVKIIQGNLFEQDISKATVIVAYLSRRLTHELQKKIKKETKKGTRIILIDHVFKSWEPVKMKKCFWLPIRLYVKN